MIVKTLNVTRLETRQGQFSYQVTQDVYINIMHYCFILPCGLAILDLLFIVLIHVISLRSTSEESGAQDSIQQHRMSRLREPSDREMSDPRGSPMTICEQLRYNELDEHSAGEIIYIESSV
ncbi:uncharacterized protein LOC111258594 isoform X2 [Varroa jacobsoni]|uniref:uncharacterized protein LOC111258594 isoform X2 n=1 Tax=Varroa jacobsoni TaxID=62625 RepID=UPI000BF2B6F5|nr:uncharacterized protein LOC111258594 isoform X2 [Varroa jacobsoni]